MPFLTQGSYHFSTARGASACDGRSSKGSRENMKRVENGGKMQGSREQGAKG